MFLNTYLFYRDIERIVKLDFRDLHKRSFFYNCVKIYKKKILPNLFSRVQGKYQQLR